ncbi:MAG: hypothetical protein K2K59_05305, partial [Muribaculaceae bacterium]|nr:hypothetical protein [Muribaculaceae bacterium]
MAKTYGGLRTSSIAFNMASVQTPTIEDTPPFTTIQDFTDNVLNDGVSRGKEFRIGALNEAVQRELSNMEIELKSDDVVITDDVIIKYVNHAKKAKDATLPFNQYDKLQDIVNNPEHIYIDTKQKELVCVFTGKENKGKIIKAMIAPNGKKGGTT